MQGILQHQIAIVTGGGQGIGKGIATVLAKAGATVVIAEKKAETGQETVATITEAGGSAVFLPTDTTSAASVQNMVEQTVALYGRIDTLVNNAGITVYRSLLEATCDDWDAVLNLNLRGYFLCSKYVLPTMIERRGGSIIHISSAHAFATLPHAEMYAASKGGINAMTRAMALSLGPYGIRVNAICPGFTMAETLCQWLEQESLTQQEDLKVRLNALVPLGRINQPEDIGQLAVYLASDASKTMTGATLLIDSGLSARLYQEYV